MCGSFKNLYFSLVLLALTCHATTIWGQKTKAEKLEWKIKTDKSENARTQAYEDLSELYLETNFIKADSIGEIIGNIYPGYKKYNQTKLVLTYLSILEKTGNYGQYLQVAPFLLNINPSKYSPEIRAEILTNIGFYHTFSNSRSKSQKSLKKALTNAKAVRDFSQACNILNLLAYEALINKEKDKAIFFTQQAIEYARRSEDKRDLAYCFNTQSNIYKYFGQNETAMRKNLLAYELVSSKGCFYEVSRFTNEIGKHQEAVKNYDGAKYYYEISLKNAEQLKDKSEIGHALSSIANILRLEGKYGESQRLSFKALRAIDPLADQIRLAETQKIIGLNYFDTKKYELANEHFITAIAYFKKGGNNPRVAEMYYLMGKLFHVQNQEEMALDYLLKSKSIASAFGSQKAKFKTYPLLSEIYEIRGDKGSSYRYMKDYMAFMNENEEVDAENKIAELGEEFRSKERDRMIARQAESLDKQKRIRQLTESKLENANLRSNQQTYLIIAILIMIVLATIIAFYRYRQAAIQQKRQQAEMSQTLLRTQMNPHFIFNAMSVIQSYIYDNDVKNSSQFLVSFSRLMRLILENSPKEYISIQTEIEILNKYLETQKLRFEDRFEYEIICPDDLIFENALIPPMITQPFVENSIEHGELHSLESGKIVVRFSKRNEMLVVEIEDNGVGRKSSQASSKLSDHESMAMSITEKRIDIINEKENSSGSLLVTDLNSLEETGTRAVISLPYKKELTSTKKVS